MYARMQVFLYARMLRIHFPPKYPTRKEQTFLSPKTSLYIAGLMNLSLRRLFVSMLCALVPLLAGCAENTPEDAAKWGDTASGARYPLTLGDKQIEVEAAIKPIEHKKGLMYRESLARDSGMLFIFPEAKRQRFWMKNTPIDLDIGYFDRNGVLQEVYPLHRRDLTHVDSRSFDIQFALEMNRGWFERNSVRPGDRIDTRAVAKILRSRGFAPALFGLHE